MVLTYVYHIKTGKKAYYRNHYRIDEGQYLEAVKNSKPQDCTRINFITDLTVKPPSHEDYPYTLMELLEHLNQYECIKSNYDTIIYKDDSEWEKGILA